MKLNPFGMANALGGATALLFAVCAILAFAAPDLVISVAKSFVHVFDLSAIVPVAKPAFSFGRFALGWISLSAIMWIFGWLLAAFYNASASPRGQA